jgi:hypothetical protein
MESFHLHIELFRNFGLFTLNQLYINYLDYFDEFSFVRHLIFHRPLHQAKLPITIATQNHYQETHVDHNQSA